MRLIKNEWESAFFQREIYQLEWGDKAAWQGLAKPAGLYQAKVASHQLDEIDWLQAQGFRFVQGEITFQIELAHFRPNLAACSPCRFATAADLPALKALMGGAFPTSRFRPPYFSAAENQRFYQHWIEQAVKGEFDDFCLIAESPSKQKGKQKTEQKAELKAEQNTEKKAEHKAEPKIGQTVEQAVENGSLQGAISLRYSPEHAQIGLLATAPNHQRQGIGKRLLYAALTHAQTQGCPRLYITTQPNNLPAIALYQQSGAKIVQINNVFYMQSE